MASVKELQLRAARLGMEALGEEQPIHLLARSWSLLMELVGESPEAQAWLCRVTLGRPSPSLVTSGRKAGAEATGKGLGGQGREVGCLRRR